MAGDEDGAPLVGEPPQQRADPQDAVEVEAVDRLVEQEHLRVAEQRGGDAEPLPHAERVPLDPTAGGAGEADLLEHLVDAADADAVGPGGDAQVVAAPAAGVHGARVEQGADLAQRLGEGADGAAEHERLAGGRPVEAEDHPHGGRLAGAVRAEEAGDLPGLDVEAEVVDGDDVAVALGEAADGDHGRRSGIGCMPGEHRRRPGT